MEQHTQASPARNSSQVTDSLKRGQNLRLSHSCASWQEMRAGDNLVLGHLLAGLLDSWLARPGGSCSCQDALHDCLCARTHPVAYELGASSIPAAQALRLMLDRRQSGSHHPWQACVMPSV